MSLNHSSYAWWTMMNNSSSCASGVIGRCSESRSSISRYAAYSVPPAGCGSGALSIQRLVYQGVGLGVLRPRHGPDRPAVKAAQRLQRRSVQRLHVLVLDLVAPVDLVGDQLRVVDDLDLARAQRPRALQPEQQPAVLGHVVGGPPQRLGGLVDHVA